MEGPLPSSHRLPVPGSSGRARHHPDGCSRLAFFTRIFQRRTRFLRADLEPSDPVGVAVRAPLSHPGASLFSRVC